MSKPKLLQEIADCAKKSLQVEVTLLASGWNGDTYTYTNSNISANTNIDLLPADDISKEQFESYQEAALLGGTQTSGSVEVVAMGGAPAIDIPVTFIIRGDT